MPRIVLVDFKNNEDAEAFVRDVARTHAVSGLGDETGFNHNKKDTEHGIRTAEVVAVVARPPKNFFCRCGNDDRAHLTKRTRKSSRKTQAWTRGISYGWWLCTHCHKPSRAIIHHFVTNMLAGANDLLPKILGEGDPISPNDRWKRDGGVPTSANLESAEMRAKGPDDRPIKQRKRRY
jgi:hypothetical protein